MICNHRLLKFSDRRHRLNHGARVLYFIHVVPSDCMLVEQGANDQVFELWRRRSNDRASEKAGDEATARTSNQVTERPNDQATERSSDPASDRLIERVSEQATERPSDQAIPNKS